VNVVLIKSSVVNMCPLRVSVPSHGVAQVCCAGVRRWRETGQNAPPDAAGHPVFTFRSATGSDRLGGLIPGARRGLRP